MHLDGQFLNFGLAFLKLITRLYVITIIGFPLVYNDILPPVLSFPLAKL